MPWRVWRAIFQVYYRGVREDPEKLARMSEEEPEADRAVFAQPGVRQVLVETFREAFRQGTSGVARDGWLMTRPWGFELGKMEVPVHLWQGDADVVVTPAMARHVARKIPECQARFLRGEGYLIWITHWSDILDALTDSM
jgi:pimeloyl-ACP methyl ester carboxylesterase